MIELVEALLLLLHRCHNFQLIKNETKTEHVNVVIQYLS